jgi:hypothetical protein
VSYRLSLDKESDDVEDYDFDDYPDDFNHNNDPPNYCQDCLDEDDPSAKTESTFLYKCAVCLRSPRIRQLSKHRVSWHVAGVYLDEYFTAPKYNRHSKYAYPAPTEDCLDCDEDVNTFDAVWQEFGAPPDAVAAAVRKRRPGKLRSSDEWSNIRQTLQDIGLAAVICMVLLLLCWVGWRQYQNTAAQRSAATRRRAVARAARGPPAASAPAAAPRDTVMSSVWQFIRRCIVITLLYVPCVGMPIYLLFSDPDNPEVESNLDQFENPYIPNGRYWGPVALDVTGAMICVAWSKAPLAPFKMVFRVLSVVLRHGPVLLLQALYLSLGAVLLAARFVAVHGYQVVVNCINLPANSLALLRYIAAPPEDDTSAAGSQYGEVYASPSAQGSSSSSSSSKKTVITSGSNSNKKQARKAGGRQVARTGSGSRVRSSRTSDTSEPEPVVAAAATQAAADDKDAVQPGVDGGSSSSSSSISDVPASAVSVTEAVAGAGSDGAAAEESNNTAQVTGGCVVAKQGSGFC